MPEPEEAHTQVFASVETLSLLSLYLRIICLKTQWEIPYIFHNALEVATAEALPEAK